jgi:GTP-binding protein
VLALKPQIVAANKMDVTNSEENIKTFQNAVEAKGYKVFPISAATGKGLKELMYYAGNMLAQLPETGLAEVTQDEEVVYSVAEEKPFEIRKEGNTYIVEGDWVRRIVGSVNLESYESLQYFQRAIKKKGIIDTLESMGINEGDPVKLYDVEFEYIR